MRHRILAAAGVLVLVVGGWWWRDRAADSLHAASPPPKPRTTIVQRDSPQRVDAIAQPGVMLIDADPAGTLRLEGQVVDGDAHGVAGATVVLSASPPRTVVTEDDGSFAFDRLIGRRYTLVARGAKGVGGPITTRLTSKSDPVVLRLRPAGTLTVAVVGGDGKPVDGAIVELRGIGEQRATVKATAAVFSPVLPGSYQIAAWADGMARAFQGVQVGTGDTQARLILSPGAPVLGRVVDDRGDGVADAQVRFTGASDGSQQADARCDGTVTAADGTFRFDALPAGSFRFIATHPERAPGTSTLVTLDGRRQRDGVVIALTAGAVVRGHVVDSQRLPIASARVEIYAATGTRVKADDTPRQAYSNADGSFEIRGLPRKQLSAKAQHDTGASQAVPVDTSAGDVADLALTLNVKGTISGVVVDPLGRPVEGAQVMVGLAFVANRELFDAGRGRVHDFAQEQTDASGKFTLTGLAPGQWRILAVPPSRSPAASDLRNGVTVTAGASDVRLVVSPDGGVQGRVAFSDGSAPEAFSVTVEQNQRSFLGGDGKFRIDGLPPVAHKLEIRGPGFSSRTVEPTIEPSGLADAGTITVVKGRSIAGTVIADGQPVAGATVYAGRMVLGTGTTAQQATSPQGAAPGDDTRTVTTDANGGFSLFGLSSGDVTLIAEHEAVGRSRALRLTEVMPGQTQLTIALEKFGALRGTLHNRAPSSDGVAVTCQSTSTPGAVFHVLAGPDGAFRFDRLAPDVYKVSATLRASLYGARFYSREVTVAPGQEATVDLSIDPGNVTLTVTAVAGATSIATASAWLASGSITAKTMTELTLKLAAAGPGTSIRLGIANGEPKQFTDLTPGLYSVCITPLPLKVKGNAALTYLMSHSDSLATFCQPVSVAPSPDAQSVQVAVELPPFIADGPVPHASL